MPKKPSQLPAASAPAYEAYLAMRETDNRVYFRLGSEKERALEFILQDSSENQSEDSEDYSLVAESTPAGVEHEFLDILENINSSMAGFHALITLSGGMAKAATSTLTDHKIRDYANKNLDLVSGEDEAVKLFGIKSSRAHEVVDLFESRGNILSGFLFFPPAILMSAVAFYDSVLSDILRVSLRKNPERYSKSDRSYTYAQLMSMGSLDDIVGSIVEDEIDDLMRGGHAQQIVFIDKTFKVKIKDDFDLWSNFIEVFERRNIVTHAKGISNDIYVRNCKEAGVKEPIPAGTHIVIGSPYIRDSVDVLHEMLLRVLFCMWEKVAGGYKERLYFAFNDTAFRLLKKKRFTVSARILKYILDKDDISSSEEARRMMAVNLAIASKSLDDDKAATSALDRFQWEACSDNFKLCIAAVREDIEAVVELMEKVSRDGSVTGSNFRAWPAFNWVRGNPDVRAQFEKVFGESLLDTPASDKPKSSVDVLPPAVE